MNGLQFTDYDDTENNNGMFDDGSGFGVNSASDMSTGFFDNILDPTGFVKGFYNDMMGFTSQEREFEQQQRMTDKQNQWNSAQEQMKRAKEAGINPLTAAGAISGNGSPGTAPAGGAAVPSSALADTVQKIGSLGANNSLAAAEAENQRSQANKTNAEVPFVPLLAHGQNMKYFGEFVQSMKDVGIAEIQSGGIAFDMMSGGLHKALDYLSLCSGLRNVDKQMKLIENEYQLDLKDLESYDVRLNSNLSLQEKQGLKAAADAAKAKLESNYIQKKIDLEKSLPGITLLQGGNLATHLAWKYGVDSPEFKAFENGVYNYAYQSQLGNYDARVNTVYDEMFNSAAGAAAGNAENEAYLSFLRQNEEWVKQYLSFKFSPDYEIFLSKLTGWIGPEYDNAAKTAEVGRGMPQFKDTLPHYRDYKK